MEQLSAANLNGRTPLNDLLYAMQQRNLVYNGDFRYFSNQTADGSVITYNTPDGWVYDDQGTDGYITFDPQNNCCVIAKSEGYDAMTFSQALHEFPRWKDVLIGRTVSAKVYMDIVTNNPVTVSLSDGINTDSITVSVGRPVVMDVSLTIDQLASGVYVTVTCSMPFTTMKISQVFANVGQCTIEGLPCMVQGVIGERRQYVATETAPAEELSLCEAPVELGDGYTRLNSVLSGRFGTGTNGGSLLPDMRGYFSRSWNNGATIDPDAGTRTALGGTITGDNVGTVEEDAFAQHDHQLSYSPNQLFTQGDAVSATTINTTTTSDTGETGGNETRPKNISELFTIKWA
ncbi:hypothetical protein ACE38W_02480 [Chitinophaga sp. Hz27]|uniref:hypothetical protein n=1 Tax=Chitinophaga sp. Hz27 TaxID=3347169 RepID=UPI0035E06038